MLFIARWNNTIHSPHWFIPASLEELYSQSLTELGGTILKRREGQLHIAKAVYVYLSFSSGTLNFPNILPSVPLLQFTPACSTESVVLALESLLFCIGLQDYTTHGVIGVARNKIYQYIAH